MLVSIWNGNVVIYTIETVSLVCHSMRVRSQTCPIDGSMVVIPRHVGGVAVEGVVGDEALGEVGRSGDDPSKKGEAACGKGGELGYGKSLQGEVDARGNWNRLCRLLDASV